MEILTKQLNDMQKEAVLSGDGPVLILAGAGSGKTKVLTSRIGYLVREKGVSPYSILAITFTNKAAREIKERVGALFGENIWFPWAGTFHSICLKMLRMYPDSLGYKPGFAIYDQVEQKTLVKDCLSELNMDSKMYPPRGIVHAISRAKDELVSPEQFRKNNESDFKLSGYADVYDLYQKHMLEYNAMDFGDLIANTVRMLEENKGIRSYFQNAFRYILIDEYQDTNRAQYKLANILSKVHGNIFVVGDDDQSIYGWRGADIRNILDFEDDNPGCTVIRLEQNYRSTQNILAAANDVISNNDGRKGKTLWSDNGRGSKLRQFTANNDYNEAAKVAQIINREAESGRAYSEFAVFYRMNAQSLRIEQALKQMNIPYKVFGGMSFFQRKEIKDILAYMRLSLNPDDNIQLKRVINEPKRGIGKTTVSKIEDIGLATDESMYSVINKAGEYNVLRNAERRIQVFADIIKKIREGIEDKSVEDVYDQAVELSGIIRNYETENTIESKSRIQNIKELKSAIQQALEDYPEQTGEDLTLETFIEGVTLSTDMDEQEEGPFVSIMTLHSAKGLEFPTVFMVGMEEGIFPSNMSISESPERLEEERRLCYVGITRAKSEVYLMDTGQRTLFGRTSSSIPSRFLREINPDLIEGIGGGRYGRRQSRKLPSSGGVKITRGGKPLDIRTLTANQGEAADVKIGNRVLHKKFGEGTVSSSEGKGADRMIVVEFDDAGTKRLMASYARLKIIEEG